MAIGGSKGKSKQSTNQTMNQTQTSTLTPEAKALLMGRLDQVQGQTYQGLDPNAYQAFESPYIQEVINATSADIDAARGVASAEQRAAALGRGAKGLSDRRGVYEAELDDRFGRTKATTIAGLRQGGFAQAQGIAAQENANKNTFDAGLQDRITQLLALLANDRTTTSSGTSSGTSKGSTSGFNFSFGQ